MSADRATISGFKSAYTGLTLAQRRCLKAIVGGKTAGQFDYLCESLVDVGLVHGSKGVYVATDAGRYVVKLCNSADTLSA